ncbi:MBL fold metallo-hydrolase [Ensifer sp. 4252]|uniref:MBL fold metallo-hydrolase n=1 Tax=Ensifer sp. 4252 TaxID=3373915 RepID=UPI003D24C0A1
MAFLPVPLRRCTAAEFWQLLCAAIFLSAAALPLPARAAAFAEHQAPGFYRFYLGYFEITALSAGTHPFPIHEVLTKTPATPAEPVPLDQAAPGKANALLAESNLTVPVQESINAFLVNTGTKLILIDSGAGALYGECCGQLLNNLRSSGYSPEQVDEIYITHLHADHVGGIAPGGKIAFKNAIVRASRADANYWLDAANEKKAPPLLTGMFESERAALTPYVKAGKFKPFAYGDTMSPGIMPMPTPGHTPGHTSYQVESDGQKLLVWGDVVHVFQIQFPDPAVTVAYDSDARGALAERVAIFSDAAQKGYLIGAAHISFPGLGHVRARDGNFYWVPANYDGSPKASD